MIIDLHPSYIENKGKTEYVVLPIDEFKKIEAVLEDYEDLIELRNIKRAEYKKPGKTIEEVREELK